VTKKKAEQVLRSASEAREKVLEQLVPLAIDTLRRLLTVDEDKVRLAAADSIMLIAGVKEKKTSSESAIQLHLTGQHIQTAIGGLDRLKEAKVIDVQENRENQENRELPKTPTSVKEKRAGNRK